MWRVCETASPIRPLPFLKGDSLLRLVVLSFRVGEPLVDLIPQSLDHRADALLLQDIPHAFGDSYLLLVDSDSESPRQAPDRNRVQRPSFDRVCSILL